MIIDRHGNPLKPTMAATTSTKGRNNPNPIISRIAHQFKDRSRKDIDKWRAAIALCEDKENPRRDFLIDLIEDLITDGHVQSQLLIRRAATLNTPFQIQSKKTGQVDKDKTELIQSKWFYDIIEECINSVFYGYSVMELISIEDGKPKFELAPRKNVVPNRGYIIPDLSNPEVKIPYNLPDQVKWILTFGNEKDLGALNNVVPNMIWKRNVMQSWAEFCEKFGIPLVTATTLRNDEKVIDHVEEMLQQLGEAAYAVFPEGTQIDFKDAEKRDTYEVFNQKKKANNEEISKALIGGTMVSDDGSSRSQSEVHERNLEERIAPMDRREISFFVNDTLLPLLAEHGIGFTDDDKFVFELNQEIEVKEHWEIVKGMMDEGYEIEDSWLSKTFNVPITGKKKSKPNLTQ